MEENNRIVLLNEDGEEETFEVIELITIDETEYIIAQTIEEDEYDIIFRIDEEDGEEVLTVVDDDEEIDMVAGFYYEDFGGEGKES